MPELPEVETTVRALQARIHLPAVLMRITVRNSSLRIPVPDVISKIHNAHLHGFRRQAKYIVLDTTVGSVIVHLGMSGRLLIVDEQQVQAAVDKHTHAIFAITHPQTATSKEPITSLVLFRDPRRFGLIDWQAVGAVHDRLRHLGVEPLTSDWSGEYLYAQCKKRRLGIRDLIMHQQIVVGIGNIYAAETLFRAGVRPTAAASRISKARAALIVQHSKAVLREAIACGGSSLKDFYSPENKQGYFVQKLAVYGRQGEPCAQCQTLIARVVHGGRSVFFCPHCQKR